MGSALGERLGRLAMALAALALVGAPAALAAEALSYQVNVNKVADSNLSTAVQSSSTLIELQDRPPEDVTGLRARAVEDLDRLQKALRSAGYYDGQVGIKVDGQEVSADLRQPLTAYEDNAKKKLPVAIAITPGPLYKIRKIDITGADGIKTTLKIKPGDGSALVERGLLRRQLGDIGGARRDFQAALKTGSGAVAADAKANLDDLSP